MADEQAPKVTQAARDAFANWESMFSVWPVRDSKHSVAIAKAAFLAGFEAHRHQAEQRGGEVVACSGCEGKPAPENNPCAVCGTATLPQDTRLLEALVRIQNEGDARSNAIATAALGERQ